jgi:alcohol dehydrogenase class IV
MLLAAHLAGAAMASTGLGVCHAIGHSLGSRFGIPHGAALSVVLPQVLGFNLAACQDRLADVAFALGAGTPEPARPPTPRPPLARSPRCATRWA